MKKNFSREIFLQQCRHASKTPSLDSTLVVESGRVQKKILRGENPRRVFLTPTADEPDAITTFAKERDA
jgi:hypothetical protein